MSEIFRRYASQNDKFTYFFLTENLKWGAVPLNPLVIRCYNIVHQSLSSDCLPANEISGFKDYEFHKLQ